jgi:hypothetical protein
MTTHDTEIFSLPRDGLQFLEGQTPILGSFAQLF